MTLSTKFGVEIFDRVVWAFGPCIAAWPYLRPVLTIDTGFLLDRYASKLFMACVMMRSNNYYHLYLLL
jgi:hypothetical protein